MHLFSGDVQLGGELASAGVHMYLLPLSFQAEVVLGLEFAA